MGTIGRSRMPWMVAAAAVFALALSPAGAARAADEPRGAGEGIKVHGHWTIDIKNPDGSLVSHNEFENEITEGGKDVLNKLLGVQHVISIWAIAFGDANGQGDQSPCMVGTTTFSCYVNDPRGGDFGRPQANFPTLTKTTPPDGPNAGKLVFSGTATAANPQQSRINWVSTQIFLCPSPALPNTDCPTVAIARTFTFRQLASAVVVEPQQIIQISVVFSFS